MWELYQLYRPDFDMFDYSPDIYLNLAKKNNQTGRQEQSESDDENEINDR